MKGNKYKEIVKCKLDRGRAQTKEIAGGRVAFVGLLVLGSVRVK